jgi:hypothetical protein
MSPEIPDTRRWHPQRCVAHHLPPRRTGWGYVALSVQRPACGYPQQAEDRPSMAQRRPLARRQHADGPSSALTNLHRLSPRRGCGRLSNNGNVTQRRAIPHTVMRPLALPAPSFRPAPSGAREQDESLITFCGHLCVAFGRCAAALNRLEWEGEGRGRRKLRT